MGEEKEIISGCPSCGSRYKVPPGFLGKTLSCKKCGTPFKLIESSENQTDTSAESSKGFEITVSEDGLSASLSLKNEVPLRPSLEDIKAALAARGICHGIVDDGSVESLLNREQGRGPFKIAQGMAPVQGGTTIIRHLFNTDPLKVGEIKEGGSMDFRERGPVPQVKQGDLLAEKVSPDDGIPGVDIYGREVAPPLGTDVKLRPGKGTRLSEDGTKLFANAEGRPELRADGKVYVFSDLEIDGDVNMKTGHVDFQGNIVVAGTVQSGFRAKGGSLTANEILKAEVETAGDVAVFGGIIGATIRTGGHVRARYIHDANIEALGDIVVEKEIIDSRIETSGHCNVKKGHILSCQIQAKKGIEAAQIGSDSSRQCLLTVGTNDRARNEIERLKASISTSKQGKKEVEGRVQDLERESQDINSKIGILAQQQDRALVNKRKILAKLDEIHKIGDPGQVDAVKKLLELLDQEIGQREKSLDSFLETQEKVTDQISKIQLETQRLDGEIAAMEDEIGSIAEWAQSERGNPFVKVFGAIYQYTSVKGIYAAMILPETHRRVLIKETRARGADDKVEWRIKISRL